MVACHDLAIFDLQDFRPRVSEWERMLGVSGGEPVQAR